MDITRTQLDALVDDLYDLSQPELEFEIRDDYSGRGMSGKTCLGFVTDNVTTLHGAICAILARAEATGEVSGDFYEGPNWWELRASSDNMGRSGILYYPNLNVVDDEDQD